MAKNTTNSNNLPVPTVTNSGLTGDKKKETPSGGNVDRGWLPAPYNVVVEPVDAGGNTTAQGHNYAESYNRFKTLAARADQTEEAKTIRSSWTTPPHVSIENGRIKLHGSKKFLESDTAKELREIFKSMEGKTYETESLNEQIAAWNVNLATMGEDYINALDTLNEMNYSIKQTATNAHHDTIDFETFLRIANNARIGKAENALTTDDLIFVGYEWDDNGKRIPKYQKASEFAADFNSTPKRKGHAKDLVEAWNNRSADSLISGKRRAWEMLSTQAKNGDAAAIAKMVYLQGGSEGGPANVLMSGEEKFNDFISVSMFNAMNSVTQGFEAATAGYNVFFLNPLGIPRFAGNAVRAIQSGDINKFWESDSVQKMADEMNDVTNWANTYFYALTPASTQLAATVGNLEGTIAMIGYGAVSAAVGQELMATASRSALAAAGNALERSGHGVRIMASVESATGKLQNIATLNNGLVVNQGKTLANAAKGAVQLDIVLPKFIVEKMPGLARAIVQADFTMQLASKGITLAGAAGSDAGIFTTSTNGAFNSLFTSGVTSLAKAGQQANQLGKITFLGKESLNSMRRWATGMKFGINLYMAGNYSAIRHIDRYLRDSYAGKDNGDMAAYVGLGVARDMVIAGGIAGFSGLASLAKQIRVSNATAPTRIVDVAQAEAANSTSGFYSSGSGAAETAGAASTANTTSAASAAAADSAVPNYTEITSLADSLMSTNGERFFVPNDMTKSTVVPGTTVATEAGAINGVGTIRNNKIVKVAIVPEVGGFNVVSTITNLKTGDESTSISFHDTYDSALKQVQEDTIPVVNPRTIGSSDLATSANVAPLSVGGLSAIRNLPDGTSRLRISPDILYLSSNELDEKVSSIIERMSEEIKEAFDGELASIDIDDMATALYESNVNIKAPYLEVPTNVEEAKELARSLAAAKGAIAHEGNRGVLIPVTVNPKTTTTTAPDTSGELQTKYERVFISDKGISPYEDAEYDPVSLHHDYHTDTRNEWSNDAENGPMTYAVGRIPDYTFMEDIMTPSAIADGYDKVGKTDVYNAVNAIGTYVWFAGGVTPAAMENAIEQKLSELMEIPFNRTEGPDIFTSNLKSVNEYNTHFTLTYGTKDLYEYTDEALLKRFDNAASRIANKVSNREDQYEDFSEVYVNRAHDVLDVLSKAYKESLPAVRKWLEENAMKDGVIKNRTLAIAQDRLYNEALEVYKDVQHEAVAKDVRKRGVDTQRSMVVPAQIDTEHKIAIFTTDKNDMNARLLGKSMHNGDEVIIHIPRGTKVQMYEHNINRSLEYEWAVDLSKGWFTTGGEITDSKELKPGKAPDVYVNRKDGSVYKTKDLEYNPIDCMVYSRDPGESDVSKYKKLGSTVFEKTNAVPGYSDTDYTYQHDGNNMYEITKPSGIVNRINKNLRKYGLVEDSVSSRFDMMVEDLASETAGGTLDIPAEKLTDTMTSWLFHTPWKDDYGTVYMNGSPLQQELSRGLSHGSDAHREFHDKYVKIVTDVLYPRVEELGGGDKVDLANLKMIGSLRGDRTPLPHSVVAEVLAEVKSLVDEMGPSLPSGLSNIMSTIVDFGNRGSHRVKDVPILFTHRGVSTSGSFINSKDGDLPFEGMTPGDRYEPVDFLFTTMNDITPFAYTGQNYGQGDNHQYVLTIGHPEGSEVYYYGDDDKDFNFRVHRNDGGAIVTPIAAGMTCVSRVELSENITWLTFIRDNADGTPYSGPLDEPDNILYEELRKVEGYFTKTTSEDKKYIVVENGVTKGSFSDINEAMDFKNKGDRQIYELDKNAPVLDRPPVTTDSIYSPTIRSDSAIGKPVEDPTFETPTYNAEGEITKFNDLMMSLPHLADSPTDYTQAVVDIAGVVKSVYDGVSGVINLDEVYEDYARQIAEGAEQPTIDSDIQEKLKPLTTLLDALGHYFDPSGKSLTKEFYLPTGAPGKKLLTIEDAILHPDKVVDVDHPTNASFDDLLVDPLRIGDSGFWEKRTGELFRDEDGNFTMAKAGTLEENLIAYTVSALTRGQNALLVAANNEVAFSKYNKNRNQITTSEAFDGLKSADRARQKIRAAQIKNARSYSRKEKAGKISDLKDNYSDEETIKAIEDAYKSKDFAKQINYTRNTNASAKKLGFRSTLEISPIKGSALRFGSNSGFKGVANDIRKASHITISGTQWVRRKDRNVCVGFGLSENQLRSGEYEATVTEPAVNLGDTALMIFSPDRAASNFYSTILEASKNWAEAGGWGLVDEIQSFVEQSFPLIQRSDIEAKNLFQKLTRNFNAYGDETALWLANQATISSWIKTVAAKHINTAIQMSDIEKLDDRTIDAIDQIMTKALVGSSVYNSKIVGALQQSVYMATLAFNPSPVIGNMLSEPARAVDFFGSKIAAKAVVKFFNPKQRALAQQELGELTSYLDNSPESVGIAENAKNKLTKAFESFNNASMSMLQKSEDAKNIIFWLCAKENAKIMYPDDKVKQMQNAMRTFNDVAIAGGAGTTPGIANSSLGRLLTVLKTFTLRNWDDFIEMTEKVGYGTTGSSKWDGKREKTGGGGYSSNYGKAKFNKARAARFFGGTLLRRYILWLTVLSAFNRSIFDALGGDPTGLTDSRSRGLYDDEGTDEYEGMQPIDNIINAIPTAFIFSALQDFYFAARRAGVETKSFFGPIDIDKDATLQKDLRKHLPLNAITSRIGDMLDLMDRGYSFNSRGNKTFQAPQTIYDTIMGFALGKNVTSNAKEYNKYRYGSVDIWGDISNGDWLDFAMSANPVADMFDAVKFDTTRKDYNGVFSGAYSDVPTMQAAIADLRNRRKQIIEEYREDLTKYTGDFQGLSTAEKEAKAKERRDKKIETFTEDVLRLVNAYQSAGNDITDKQISNMMWLFDFGEDTEDESAYDIARRRYVEAGLPDVSPTAQPAKTNNDGEVEEPTYMDRSLIYQNAVQGRYGRSRRAAEEVKATLSEFKKTTYKEYKKKVDELNDKAYAASKGSATRKKYQEEVEKVQKEYLNELYNALTPVVRKYGSVALSSNDVVAELQPLMSSMIPYSTIKKYGLQFNSGNDIVWGQLSDWIKNKWGTNAPTAPSDEAVRDGLFKIKNLIDSGKTGQAKSEARLLLERIARGSLSARDEDVKALRKVLYNE